MAKNPFIRTKISKGVPLTTDQVLNASPGTGTIKLGPGTAQPKPSLPQILLGVSNTAACLSAGVPPSPPLLPISNEFQPAVGVYLLSGPTGSGKSVLSLSLALWANAQKVPASYVSVFEPRSADIRSGASTLFSIPTQFLDDAAKAISNTPGLKLVIFDSATLPMKANAANPAFEGQATFPGGSQPSDRGFLDSVSRLALKRRACIILDMNSTLIPYVNDLEGAVEGIMTVQNVSSFGIKDRTSYSARTSRTLHVPLEFTNAALSAFNFSQYSGSTRGFTSRGYRGFPTNKQTQ
jgi:hypothetical protein